jgi:hypothetical protein
VRNQDCGAPLPRRRGPHAAPDPDVAGAAPSLHRWAAARPAAAAAPAPAMPPSAEYVQRCLHIAGCYPADLEARLVADLVQVLHLHPSLSINVDTYVSNEGVSQRLVYFGGTVPIVYRAATYNIPVRIWIMTYHPSGPPVIFVRPNQTMELREKHMHVDANGQVYLPELAGWDAARSTIPDVVAKMTAVFSRDPPLFGRPTAPRVVPSEQERLALARTLTERVLLHLENVTADGRAEHSALQRELGEVRLGATALTDAERQLSTMSSGSTEALANVRAEIARVDAQLQENNVDAGDLPADAVLPVDALTGQVVDCVARDLALRDSLDCLSGALGAGVTDLNAFLKETRRISRELYMVRALKLKVRRRQAALQSAGPLMSIVAGSASQV